MRIEAVCCNRQANRHAAWCVRSLRRGDRAAAAPERRAYRGRTHRRTNGLHSPKRSRRHGGPQVCPECITAATRDCRAGRDARAAFLHGHAFIRGCCRSDVKLS
ncbi:hypothetical protein BURMUCF2_A0068 [Burkholderia multivorans CF2]|nr:hypothetical protein BURMUCF2_A0068 [Burkholderia multivorans CF2]